MAIEMNNGGQAASAAQPKQQTQQAAGIMPWSFHQQNPLGSPVSAGVGGEYFTKMRDAMIEVFKEIAAGVNLNVISLNRQNYPSLRFSALVVAISIPEVSENIVAFHTLILENTGDKLEKKIAQVDNQTIQINMVTGDAYDEVLFKSAYDAVAQCNENARIYHAGAEVIPSHVAVTKKELVEAIARNAAMACVSAIDAANPDRVQLNLGTMDRDCRLSINVAFGNHQVYDVTGAPKRSSVLIDYSSVKKTAQQYTGNNDAVNVADNTAPICKLSGFMNPIWAPADPQAGFGFAGYQAPGQIRPTQKFVSEMVITSVHTPYATSLPAVLLAISSALAMIENDSWIQAYIPKANKRADDGRVDITDIGALNIPANLQGEVDKGGFGSRVSVASMGGDLQKINQYLVSLFSPGCILSIDCPEVGPESWYLSIFAAAAGGDAEAYNQIYAAAEELTNGNFSNFFNHGDEMFSNIVRVPLGHYMAGGTDAQDIRNIDYIAICNIFQNNPGVIHEYAKTFIPGNGISPVRNLAIREGILRDALDQQCEITGYAARLTASEKLVAGLSQAIKACNLPISVTTPLNADQLRIGTPAPDFISRSVARNVQAFGGGYQGRPIQAYIPGRNFRTY